ncbi:MAG TPA: hypothetical protein VGP72_05970 [Planctomycetota bacterium]
MSDAPTSEHPVYQFIYGKVSKLEDSPARDGGYHIIFRSTTLPGAAQVMPALQQMMLNVVGGLMKEREAVFYWQIEQQWYLVVLCVRPQPEARDIDGRKGLLFVHGLLFPPALWQPLRSPTACLKLVENRIFTTLDAALASAGLDRAKGALPPLQVSADSLRQVPPPPLPSDQLDLRLAIFLNQLARSPETAAAAPSGTALPTVLLQGPPREVGELLSTLSAYVPAELRVRLGWDPAQDGLGMVDYPFRLAGFSDERPTGRYNALVADLQSRQMAAAGDCDKFFAPQTSYEHWLAEAGEKTLLSPEDVEPAYAWSHVLESGPPLPREGEGLGVRGLAAPDPEWLDTRGNAFAFPNAAEITQVFQQRLSDQLGPSIAAKLCTGAEVIERLLLLGERLPPAAVASLVERACLQNQWVPTTQEQLRLHPLLENATAATRFLDHAWTDTAPPLADFKTLQPGQQRALIEYFASSLPRPPSWLFSLLQEYPPLASHLLSIDGGRDLASELVTKELAAAKMPEAVARLAIAQAVQEDALGQLFAGQIASTLLIEKAFPIACADKRLRAAIITWAKTQELPPECPCLRAFANLDQASIPAAGENGLVRPLLLAHLANNRWTQEMLASAGFSDDEITAALKPRGIRGWLTRLKRILPWRRKKPPAAEVQP